MMGENMMRVARISIVVLGLLGLTTPAVAASISPMTPQPKAADLKDGLAVRYYTSVFENILDLLDFMRIREGTAGTPISELNYKVGVGKVLTSNGNDFVGAHITGAIHLESAGTYKFEVTSNDGVRVNLGGQQIFQDPGVHPDTTSDPIPVEVTQPSWYPLEILYFEKKNTSTLILRWQPPGSAGYEVVPAAALKHAAAP
jgi:hypothetical protein